MSGHDDDTRDAGTAHQGKEPNKPDGAVKNRRGQNAGPVDLDERRSTIDRAEAGARRDLLADIRANQDAERRRQEALEAALFANPAKTWAEAAGKAEYLLRLLTGPAYVRNPDHLRIVADVVDDFSRLRREEQKQVAPDGKRKFHDPDNHDDVENPDDRD
jgi:hypothetical protein